MPLPPTPRMAIALVAITSFMIACSSTQPLQPRSHEPTALDDIAAFTPPPTLAGVIDNATAHRVQILVSEVVPARDGRPTLRRSAFRLDAEYFYPASTVKLLAAIAAAEKCDEIDSQRRALAGPPEPAALDAPIAVHPLFADQSLLNRDDSNLAGAALTLRHTLRKLFLVSDNPAYNRLYEFLGQNELNTRLWAAGLASCRLSHRLSEGRTREENRLAPQVDVLLPGATLSIPPRTGDLPLSLSGISGLDVGAAYLSGGQRVERPMNFANMSRISLLDMQNALVLLARPDIDLALPGFRLAPATRAALLDLMREYPGDSANPVYNRAEYPDDYGKFFLPGLTRVAPKTELRIANKVGQAYGFTIDNAYIEHVPTARAFFLTAVLYTNSDAVLNDNVYEYDQIAFPFMADLAEHVARRLWSRPAR